MRAAPVQLVASWDGWCGPCADVRPLVLTRTGRRSPASWWAGESDEDRPLTLTCRLCGVGVDVPLHEEDDPPAAAVLEAALAVSPGERGLERGRSLDHAAAVPVLDLQPGRRHRSPAAVADDAAGPSTLPAQRAATADEDSLALLAAGWPG